MMIFSEIRRGNGRPHTDRVKARPRATGYASPAASKCWKIVRS